SSAVVPLVVQQLASSRSDEWWAADSDLALWTLTPVEIASALWRLSRDGALPEEQARQAETRVEELARSSHVVVDVDRVKALAHRLLRVHALRAADALQLGAALLWAGGRPQHKTLHTLDSRLALAARREGFDVP